jgi:hypothetical protein
MMHMSRLTASLLLLAPAMLGLASCGSSTAVVSLDYQPNLSQGINGPRVVNVGRFADMRRQDGFTLGVIRTPVGTPLEKVATRIPVDEVVRNGFAHGLESRRMLAGGDAPYVLTGEVYELQGQQILRPTATVRVRVNLVRAATGRIVFSQVYEAERQSSAYVPGSGSPVPQMREIISRTLQNVIDRALDDQRFRARIRS